MSVGNLPPKATVLIKITYVAELQVDGELISFQIPGSVAPWKKELALNEKLQVLCILKLIPYFVCMCVCFVCVEVFDPNFKSCVQYNLQSDVDTVKIDGDERKEVTVQISVEMPFDIRTIQCPTHKVKVKVRFSMCK